MTRKPTVLDPAQFALFEEPAPAAVAAPDEADAAASHAFERVGDQVIVEADFARGLRVKKHRRA